jgi:hypothetical protein
VTDQLANRQVKHMRQIFERIDVDIVGAAGQEAVERCPIVFVNNGAGVRRRQAVLPQDRQDVRAAKALMKRRHQARIGKTLAASTR